MAEERDKWKAKYETAILRDARKMLELEARAEAAELDLAEANARIEQYERHAQLDESALAEAEGERDAARADNLKYRMQAAEARKERDEAIANCKDLGMIAEDSRKAALAAESALAEARPAAPLGVCSWCGRTAPNACQCGPAELRVQASTLREELAEARKERDEAREKANENADESRRWYQARLEEAERANAAESEASTLRAKYEQELAEAEQRHVERMAPVVEAARDRELQRDTLRAALEELRNGPDTLTPDGLRIVNRALSEQDKGLLKSRQPGSRERTADFLRGGPAESDCTCQRFMGRANCPVHGEQDKGPLDLPPAKHHPFQEGEG